MTTSPDYYIIQMNYTRYIKIKNKRLYTLVTKDLAFFCVFFNVIVVFCGHYEFAN